MPVYRHVYPYGIASNNTVKTDASDIADNDYAKFTANGLEGRSYAETLSDIGAMGLSQYLTNMEIQAIMNGDFQIWQRGSSSTAIADVTALYRADRWFDYVDKNGGTLPTLARVMGTEIINTRYQNFSRLTMNGAGTSLGVSSYHNYSQRIEHGTRKLCGDGKQVTVSFWARTDVADKRIGIYLIQTYGTVGSPTGAETINGTNFALTTSWAKYSYTFTTNTLSGKTFGTANDDYLQVNIRYIWGTTTDEQVGATTAETYVGSGYVDIAEVMLSEGSIEYPCPVKDYNTVLSECQRYYYRNTPDGAQPYGIVAHGWTYNNTTRVNGLVHLPVKMRVAPTALDYANLQAVDSITVLTLSKIELGDGNNSRIAMIVGTTTTGVTQYKSAVFRQANNSAGYLGFTAEL